MLTRLIPTRNKMRAEGSVVADLDALLNESVYFKLHGKTHEIKPLSAKQFLILTNNLGHLLDLKEKSEITPDELVDRYYDLVSSCCETISKDDIKNMTQQQIAGLFQLVMDALTGKAQAQSKHEIAEKKTLNT